MPNIPVIYYRLHLKETFDMDYAAYNYNYSDMHNAQCTQYEKLCS